MLVIPQTVSNGFISFESEGIEAKWDIIKKEFEAGKEYEYSLHIDLPKVEVSGELIHEWEKGGKYPIDTKKPDTNIDIINSLLVKITGDTYLIGSPQGEGSPNEWPQHKAGIGTFWIAPYEITNEQYVLFLNKNNITPQQALESPKLLGDLDDTAEVGFNDKNIKNKWFISKEGRESYPITNVTWYGARAFARWLGGDLPTEREWETACRAGSEGLFSFDDSYRDNMVDYVNCKERSDLIYDRELGTMPVNSLKHNMEPKPKGLYHMHGNVSEWCLDAVTRSASGSPASYAEEIVILKQNEETLRVVRGGSWKSLLEECRSAFRNCLLPTKASDEVGFRVVFPIKNILDIKAEPEHLKNLEDVISLVK
jgi:formylglycine-generating enzyme required for sulfatase activity